LEDLELLHPDRPDWADFRAIRNWVNQKAYEQTPRIPLWQKLLEAVGFVLSVRLALFSSGTLIFQFMIGAVSLYFLAQLAQKLKTPPLVIVARLEPSLREAGFQPACLGILAELFRMRAAGNQDFPLQQNALLVLVLISVQQIGSKPHESDLRWIMTEVSMGLLFLLLRWWEGQRKESNHWLSASRAIQNVCNHLRLKPNE